MQENGAELTEGEGEKEEAPGPDSVSPAGKLSWRIRARSSSVLVVILAGGRAAVQAGKKAAVAAHMARSRPATEWRSGGGAGDGDSRSCFLLLSAAVLQSPLPPAAATLIPLCSLRNLQTEKGKLMANMPGQIEVGRL